MDTILGTANDDVVEGTTATLGAADRIVDASITDNDVFNLTATANPVAMDVTNIENININWDAFSTPTIDLDNVAGATVTLSSAKSGYLGNANFVNVGENNVTLGAGVVGTVAIGAIEDATVEGGNAKTLTIGGAGAAGSATEAADGNLVVNANNTKTVSVIGADELILSATTATDITVDVADVADITLGVDADLDLTGALNATAEITLRSTAAVSVDLATGTVFDVLTLAGDNAVTLDFADTSDVDRQEIVNGGAIILANDAAANLDLSKVSHTSITFESSQVGGGGGGATITTTTGSNFVFDAEVAVSGDTVTFTTGTKDAAADTITVTVNENQAGGLEFAGTATTDFETVTIIANAEAVTGVDLTLANVQAGTGKVVFQSATNELTVSEIEAKEVDATAVAGAFSLTSNDDVDMTVAGGSKKNTVVFAAVDNDSTFIGQDGEDIITFVNAGGEATAITGEGKSTITANALDDGQLSVVAGSSDDNVSATALTSGILSLQLGDGKNSVTIDGTLAGAQIVVTTGTGNDTVTIDDATTADDEVTLTLGTGTDTLAISEDITAGTLTVSGLDVIAVGANAATAIVNAALLTGQSYTITGDGDVTDELLVKADKAGSFDFSALTIDNTIAKAIGGISFDFSAAVTGNNTVVGSDGNDLFDFANASGNNTVTGGAGADAVTLDATDGEDVLIFNEGDLVEFTATSDGGDAGDAIADADTITFGDGVDYIANFEVGTDSIDLSAFGLTSGTVVVGSDGATFTIGDGKYALLKGDLAVATGVFTVDAATPGAETLIVFDADTTTGVSLVGIVVDDVTLSATDLILA